MEGGVLERTCGVKGGNVSNSLAKVSKLANNAISTFKSGPLLFESELSFVELIFMGSLFDFKCYLPFSSLLLSSVV